MSSGTAPCCGYVLPATEENLKKLKISLDDLRKEWESLGRPPNEDDIDFLWELWTEEYREDIELKSNLTDTPTPIWLFGYDREDGDIYDGLEDGLYLSFGETSLYTRQYTDFGEMLDINELFPENSFVITFMVAPFILPISCP